MTYRDFEVLKLLAMCIKQGLISGVDLCPVEKPVRISSGHCRCGDCPTCVSNAKWESKWATIEDPTYYSRPVETRMRSSLADF